MQNENGQFIGSVSAIGKLNKCQRAFFHQYVAHTEKDYDYVTPSYFGFGRAFHECLEKSEHDGSKCSTDMIRQACLTHGLTFETDGAKIAACLRSYFANSKKMKLIAVEQRFITENWNFVIDAVMEDDSWWYIVDAKTTGVKLDPIILTKLKVDPQMNLYVKHANLVAERLGLSMDKFFGICYREVEKPRIRPSTKGETWEEFTKRCGEPPYRENYLSKFQMMINEVESSLLTGLAHARTIQVIDQTVQNMQACKHMGEVCPYYSQCYGKTYTAAMKEGAEDCDKF